VTRRFVVLMAAAAIMLTACGNLGVGTAACVAEGRDLRPVNISPANVLSVQAVPTAKYTPCLNELKLGWDTVEWFAEDGRAGFRITRAISPFLTAIVTESCDISSATRTGSGHPEIIKYEEIETNVADLTITLVPSGERPLLRARILIDELRDIEVSDRPVLFRVDERIEEQVGPRVNLALLRGDFVWIIDELDAEEGTVEMRSDDPAATGSRLDPDDALDLIDDAVQDVFYRGSWYFTFEGGCITYEFDAKGTLAETIAKDAAEALGFFPASELVELAEEAGYDIR